MIRKSEIIEAIHEGVFNAHEDFEWLEDGGWIRDPGIVGIEGFLASKIFLTLNQRVEDGENLVLNFRSTTSEDGLKPKQKVGRARA